MSDDEDKKDGKKNGNGKKPSDFEKAAPEPQPKNPQFFEWLESHFDKARFPERIELRVMTGRSLERMGPRVRMFEYAAGAQKPPRTKLVNMSNEILLLAQRDCDVQQKKTAYGVLVWNLTTDDQPLEQWKIRCAPNGTYKNGGDAGLPGNGAMIRDDDEEQVSQERVFAGQIMDHQKNMVELFGHSFENMLDRENRALVRAYERIAFLETELSRKNDQLERALNMELDREERREWIKLKNEGARKGLELGFSLLPPIMSRLTGKKSDELAPTPETLTLKNFFKSLTPEQTTAVVGAYGEEPPHDLIKAGVLSFEQAKVLFDVAECRVSPDELDRLMPGGPLEISQQQVIVLSTQLGLSMEQLAPLHLLFEGLQNKKRKS